MRYLLFFASLLVLPILSDAQFYDNGQDPFTVKWKQIKTPHFNLIFSEDISLLGKNYASYFEDIYKTGGNTLGHRPGKIRIVVHNQTIWSNGEVAWAPKRMNLYTLPPQSGYSEPFSKQLALHEFRHVAQIDKLNQGGTRLLYFIFGEQAIGGVLGWHIPLWFFEGDAVAYETGASRDGRGRIPDFSMKISAQLAMDSIYSYPKAQFGSYKDFVPNHYDLGYQLIARTRQKYGDRLWDNVLNQVARSPIHPNAFSKGIKKATGLPERKLYSSTMSELLSETAGRYSNQYVSQKKVDDYKNYYSPYWIGDNVISYKTSYNDIPRIVVTDEKGEEETVFVSGNIYNKTFSYNDSVIVWNEFMPTRWENNNYNRIVRFDLRKGQKEYITKKTRAFYSRLSPDNSKILSVEVDEHLVWSLTIRGAETGRLKRSIKLGNGQPVQPSWSPDMQSIVFMSVGSNGKSLGILNIKSGKIEWVIKDTYLDMSFPVHLGSYILIKGVYSGKSNLLIYSLADKKWAAITDSEFGVGEGRLKKGKLVFSNYTPFGYELVRRELGDRFLNPINEPESFSKTPDQVSYLSQSEQYVDMGDNDTLFVVEKYGRLKNLVNVHSWAPFGIDIQNIEIGPGITFMSQNVLSTSTLTGGYKYNLTDNSQGYHVDFSYKGFFPLLNASWRTTFYNDSITGGDGNIYRVSWNTKSFSASGELPIKLDRGKWYRRVQPRMGYEYFDIAPSIKNEVELKAFNVHSLNYRLYAYNLLAKAHRHLQPRWGQVLIINYMHSPLQFSQYGQLLSGELKLYLPGLLKNHGILVYGGYQIRESGEYGYSDMIIYPFGYEAVNSEKMRSLQAHYVLPLLYPDLNVFEYLYVKRLKADAFYQFSDFADSGTTTSRASAGIDLTADVHIFRFVFPFELGGRYARRLTYSDNYYQFLFRVKF